MHTENTLRILLVDGYIDEPGCLGVPPYLAPLPRYISGAIQEARKNQSLISISDFCYKTVDQIRLQERDDLRPFDNYNCIIFITGVSVPGKYLGGKPVSYKELYRWGKKFQKMYKILCGPATKFGIGQEGGKPSRSVEGLQPFYDMILYEDAEIALRELFQKWPQEFLELCLTKEHQDEEAQLISPKIPSEWEILQNKKRSSMAELRDLAILGLELLIPQHPNYKVDSTGNLICEIETFRGCPRYHTGGCRFCIEPMKGPTKHRPIQDILDEFSALYQIGVRHFRLGAQTDFYAFQHGEYDHPKYPRPNPEAIGELLREIRKNCPDIQTLHIDNVNALNFSLYPKEARKITEVIVTYCTPGNVAAIGAESIDPEVIRMNNLKATGSEIENAIQVINQLGITVGENGIPHFLPGLNFIMGLPGETQESLSLSYEFLQSMYDKGYSIRRINLRKFLVPTTTDPSTRKWVAKHMNKFRSKYFHWKEQIRESIDQPMLKRVFPFGRILKSVYAEKHDGNSTLCRQVGTYPITCYVPKKMPLYQYYDLIVVNFGFRSLTCLEYPIKLIKLRQKELEAIDGIGKRRARAIQSLQPKSHEDWMKMEPIIQKIRLILEKDSK
ncbi:MAG: radical SAM protein [Promethearchaeota archaeon]